MDFLEIYKADIAKFGSIEECIKEGYYGHWTERKVKAAFNYGNGTMKDFMEFIRNNKQLWVFYDVENQKVYNTTRTVNHGELVLYRSKWIDEEQQ